MPSPQQSDDGATKHRHSGDLRLVSEPGVRTVDADAFTEVWVSELDTPALIQAALVTDEPLEVWLSERLDAEAATITSLPPPSLSAPALIVATGVRVPNAPPDHHWRAPVATFAFGVVAVSAMLGVAAMLGPVTLPPQPELHSATQTLSFPFPPIASASASWNAAEPVPASSGPDALATAGPREGRLRVTTDPSDARVTVDGIGWGQTPLTIDHLPIGRRTVRVTLPGYTSQQFLIDLRRDRPEATRHVTLAQQTAP